MVHGKLNSILLLVALVFSTTSLSAQQRDEETAMGIAESFMRSSSRMNSMKGIAAKARPMKLIRSGKSNAFYVFGWDDVEGFVIVSGDERMIPVLGYSASSCATDDDDMPANAAEWFRMYESEYQDLQQGTLTQRQILNASTQATDAVDPIVTAEWGQASPYYNDCPTYLGSQCVTGCVATAMAQVMYSFQYPDCGKGSVSYTTSTNSISISENLTAHPFDWSNMLDSYTTSSTVKQKSAVANLCYMAGVAVSMDYTTTGSGAYMKNAIKALVNNFGYDADMSLLQSDYMSTADWHALVQSELHKGHPLIYSGSTSTNEGHCFILDGYTPPTSSSGTPYYHINWGWNGSYNGNFALTSLNAGGSSYCNKHSVIAGIQAEDGVQTVNSMWQGSISLSAEKMKLSEVKSLTATIRLYNSAYRQFSGSIKVKVKKPDGTSETLQTTSASSISLNSGKSMTVSYTPAQTAGAYTFEIYTTATGKGTEERAYVSGNDVVTVLEEGEDLPYKGTNIQCTAMTVSLTGTNSVSASLASILNIASDEFIGNIKLALTNCNDELIDTYGSGTSITSLSHYKSLVYPRTITATISGVQDGHYRLHSASCQSGYSGWTLLRKWTRVGNYINSSNLPLYTDVWIKDGTLYLSDPDVDETDVKTTVASADAHDFTVYSLDGRRVSASYKGIKIRCYSDGRRVVVE